MGIIVNASSQELKLVAKRILKGKWGLCAITGVFVYLVLYTPQTIISSLFDSTAVNRLLDFYFFIINAALSLGITLFYLKLFRKRVASPMEIFYGFEFLLKTVLLHLVMYLQVLLWSFLFVIPGIIAAFSYSMAVYILADDPSKGVFQCIQESKRMMSGNKMRLFSLDLSFLGWYLLASVPVMILSYFLVIGGMEDPIQASKIASIGGIGLLFVTAYVNVATCGFYEVANGNMKIHRERYQENRSQEEQEANSDAFAEKEEKNNPFEE